MKRRSYRTRIFIYIVSMMLAAVSLTACFSENAKEDEIDGALKYLNRSNEKQQEVSEIPAEDLHSSYIEPLGLDYDNTSPQDSSLHASFTVKDFDLENNTLSFIAYTEEIFDAAEIRLMQIGDTLHISGRDIVVESIQDKDGMLIINGGYEDGGTELVGDSSGETYRAKLTEAGPAYLELGRSTLPISEDVTISDGYKDAASPKTATFEELEDYVGSLNGASDSFNYLTTTVRIEKGKVVDITRTTGG